MKHIYHTLTFIILFSFSNLAQAQITFTEAFFLDKIGTTETSTLVDLDSTLDLTSLVNASGPNQTWDFSGFASTDSFSLSQTYFQLPSTDVPGSDLFPDSDFAIKLESDTVTAAVGEDVGFFNFVTLSDEYYLSDGGVTIGDFDEDGNPDTLLTTFSPSSKVNPLPLTYEDMWEDSTTIIQSFAGFELPATSADINTSVVDGWGTLITPMGSFQALRIRTEFTIVNLIGGPASFTHTDIEFVSAEGVIASIFVDSDGSTFGSLTFPEEIMSGTPVEDEAGLPKDFQLSQNYPNPFNPSTTISYALPVPSDVKLTVYTLTGQEVVTLVNATQGVGKYEVPFDAASLASGLYLYRLETGTFSETRLMSLIK